jgi:hypothetical protein
LRRWFASYRHPNYVTGDITGNGMSRKAQRRATRRHRRRAAARGLTRVEIQVAQKDVALIRAVGKMLRGDAEKAKALRSSLATTLGDPEVQTAFDVFGSELADETFAGIFDQPRVGDRHGTEM